MRFGACINIKTPEQVSIIKNAGFDYAECGFAKLARATEEEFRAFAQALACAGMQAEAANSFLPGDLSIHTPEHSGALHALMETGFQRGRELGLRIAVFGSGDARAVPEGASYEACMRRLIAFLQNEVSPLAAAYGVTVVIEPLRRAECNTVNTLREGALLAAAVDRPNVRLLADNFHMAGGNETAEDMRQMAGLIRHAHISYPHERYGKVRGYPLSAGEWGYATFLRALNDAGCGTCSIEASTPDFARDAAIAIRVLKELNP